MKRPSIYWVWRRSDGYVSGTAYDPRKGPQSPGFTFEVLLDTEDWYGVAVPRIEEERARSDED
jgi:hypothetical protein